MDMNDIFLTITQTQVPTPSLFPFPLSWHLPFAILGFLFLLFQFSREKKPYQLIMSVAILLSLTIWLSDNRIFFYALGAVESLLIFTSFITAIAFKGKNKKHIGESGDNEENAENAEAPKTEAENAAADEEAK